ncbi:hypothetical protein [Aliarcobacter butzleri]|nr:hypothetical protein [Aliarcobacter butzleri]
MTLSLSSEDKKALILGVVEELCKKSLALCHFSKLNHLTFYHYLI